MKISIGFEFQTPDLSFTQIQGNAFVHPDTFLKEKITNELTVYGDAATARRKEYNRLKKTMADNSIVSFLCTIKSKIYTVTTENMNSILNDAEFVYTDETIKTVKRPDVFKYMFQRMCEALLKIDTYVSTLPHFQLSSLKEVIKDKRPRHTTLFPYQVIYKDERFGFFGFDNDSLSYNVQCTLGIEIMHIRDILCDFARLYLPYAQKDEIELLQKVLDIDSQCPSSLSLLEQDVYFLFVYFCETFHHRKGAPFLIRHLFSNMLKYIPQQTFDQWVTYLPKEKRIHDMTLEEFARTLYKRQYISMEQNIPEDMVKKRMELKEYQKLDVSSTFHASSLSRKTLLLVEFRYFHRFIMTCFFHQEKENTTLLTVHMIKKT